MEIIQQIKQICKETDNEWFLTHQFTKIGLYDLQLKENLERENIFTFNDQECTCHTNSGEECIRCSIEMTRSDEFDKLDINKNFSIYDYNTYYYTRSHWIIPKKN